MKTFCFSLFVHNKTNDIYIVYKKNNVFATITSNIRWIKTASDAFDKKKQQQLTINYSKIFNEHKETLILTTIYKYLSNVLIEKETKTERNKREEKL